MALIEFLLIGIVILFVFLKNTGSGFDFDQRVERRREIEEEYKERFPINKEAESGIFCRLHDNYTPYGIRGDDRRTFSNYARCYTPMALHILQVPIKEIERNIKLTYNMDIDVANALSQSNNIYLLFGLLYSYYGKGSEERLRNGYNCCISRGKYNSDIKFNREHKEENILKIETLKIIERNLVEYGYSRFVYNYFQGGYFINFEPLVATFMDRREIIYLDKILDENGMPIYYRFLDKYR